jgi:hypothetical protein
MAKIVRRCVRALFLWIALALSTVVLFDIGCFYVLPEYFSERFFLGYRTGLLPDGTLGRGYPHDYYETHPERGFDIGASKSARQHYIFNYPNHYSYPIWSNALGCFDVDHPYLKNYIYLAGDSTTWGYTRFEKKFGTLLEQQLQVPVVKCGVTHTGQLHQLDKMKEVIARIGEPPEVILVVWSPNDIINDAFYPHSTVVDGWQVDTTYMTSSQEIVRDTPEVLAERVRNKVISYRSGLRTTQRILIKYSASFNCLSRAMDHVSIGRWFGDSNYENPDRLSTYRLQHYPPLTPVLSYRGDNFARKNQEALLQLQAYADSIHAKLLVALLSAQKNHNAEVCDFLQEHSINFIDIGDEGYNFNDKHLSWRIDSHANEEGNEVIADALYRFIQPALGSDSRKFESPTN